MNRNDEYNALLTELETTPPALEYAYERAFARAKKHKNIRRFIAIPAGSLASFLIVFAVLVNLFAGFSQAVAKLPILRELAQAVTFSPSLSAAVANDYVQPIDLEQTQNGITMRIEYLIVDQKQLNIFYTLDSELYTSLFAEPAIERLDGLRPGQSMMFGNSPDNIGVLQRFVLEYGENTDIPEALILGCEVYENMSDVPPLGAVNPEDEPGYIASFSFELHFDPEYRQQGEIIELNESLMLDGQHITVTTVEIYPTHIRINLADDESNTAWLQGINFYLENEKGERFERIRYGTGSVGSVSSPFMRAFHAESSFFSGGRRLKLCITDATWLDKDKEHVKIDLANAQVDALPEGVQLESAERRGGDWDLVFTGTLQEDGMVYGLFNREFYDEMGKRCEVSTLGLISGDHIDKETGASTDTPGSFTMEFSLTDYPYDTVYLETQYSRRTPFPTPIEVKVK